jgi:hypothetical protein
MVFLIGDRIVGVAECEIIVNVQKQTFHIPSLSPSSLFSFLPSSHLVLEKKVLEKKILEKKILEKKVLEKKVFEKKVFEKSKSCTKLIFVLRHRW